MSGEPKTLTPEQEKAAREAFETRYKAFAWWTERFGTQHPALRKDENGDYLEEGQRKYWTGFQEGYAAALGVPVVARDEAAELRAALVGVGDTLDLIGACVVEVPPSSDAYADANEILGLLSAAESILHKALRLPELRRLAGGESEK